MSDEKSLEKLVANVIFGLKLKFGETKITADTIHIVLKEVIELVEQFSCPGEEKKKHVVTIIKVLVTGLIENTEEKRVIFEIIDNKILENTIDLIISASQGKFNINNKKTQKKVSSCMKSFAPIIIDFVMRIIKSTKKKSTNKKSTTIISREVELNVEITN